MQKFLIISSDIADQNRIELKELLQDHWKIVHTCPMPSSCSSVGNAQHVSKIMPTCFVVVEKEDCE